MSSLRRKQERCSLARSRRAGSVSDRRKPGHCLSVTKCVGLNLRLMSWRSAPYRSNNVPGPATRPREGTAVCAARNSRRGDRHVVLQLPLDPPLSTTSRKPLPKATIVWLLYALKSGGFFPDRFGTITNKVPVIHDGRGRNVQTCLFGFPETAREVSRFLEVEITGLPRICSTRRAGTTIFPFTEQVVPDAFAGSSPTAVGTDVTELAYRPAATCQVKRSQARMADSWFTFPDRRESRPSGRPPRPAWLHVDFGARGRSANFLNSSPFPTPPPPAACPAARRYPPSRLRDHPR